MEQLEQTVNGLNKKLPRASNNIRGFGNSARRAAAGFGVLNKAMIKIAAVIATIQGASFIFTSTAEIETQAKSLEILTGSAEKARDIISEIQDFSAVTPFTGSELIDTSKRLAAFGIKTEKVVETTKRLADVSGATGARINEVALAYGQIQSKGKLATEELYQLQERGIGLADELKRMYGLQGEEFVKALEKGQISAKAVEQAFINLTSESGKYFNGATAQSETLAGKWSTLIDAVTKLAQGIGQTLGPALKGILTLAIKITNRIIGMINKVNELLGIGTDNAINKLKRDIEDLESRLGANNGRRDAIINASIAKKKRELAELEGQAKAAAAGIEEVTQPYSGNLPPLLGGDSGGSKSGKSSKTSNKEAEAAERAAKALKERLKRLDIETALKTDLLALQKNINAAEAAGDEQLATRLQGDQRILQITSSTRQALIGVTDEQERAAILRNSALDIAEQQLATEQQLTGAVKETNEELTAGEQLTKDIYTTITNNLTNSIQGLIDGTKEWGDVLSDILGQLGNLFLQAGFNALGAGLGIPGFADGGRPKVGEYSIVGEEGPELVKFDQPSTVYSNERSQSMMAAMGKYSPANGGAQAAGGDGSDPGGAGLEPQQPPTINIEGGVMQFNDSSYIRQDQIPAIVNQASRQGEARALRKLQMSPAARRKAGI